MLTYKQHDDDDVVVVVVVVVVVDSIENVNFRLFNP